MILNSADNETLPLDKSVGDVITLDLDEDPTAGGDSSTNRGTEFLQDKVLNLHLIFIFTKQFPSQSKWSSIWMRLESWKTWQKASARAKDVKAASDHLA